MCATLRSFPQCWRPALLQSSVHTRILPWGRTKLVLVPLMTPALICACMWAATWPHPTNTLWLLPQGPSCCPSGVSPPLNPPIPAPIPTHLASNCIILSFQECHRNRIIQHVTVREWLSALNTVPLKFTQLGACLSGLFLFTALWYPVVWVTTICPTCHWQPPVGAIRSKAAKNISV